MPGAMLYDKFGACGYQEYGESYPSRPVWPSPSPETIKQERNRRLRPKEYAAIKKKYEEFEREEAERRLNFFETLEYQYPERRGDVK